MSYETQQQPESQPYAGSGGDGPSGPRAGFWQRFGAAFLDGLIVGVPLVVLILVAPDLTLVWYAIYFVASAIYFTVMEGGPTGQTIGKKALNIRVYDLAQGGPIGNGRAFVRWISRFLSYIPLYLGYFWSIWDSEKQTWHDKLSGAVVVPVSDYPVQ